MDEAQQPQESKAAVAGLLAALDAAGEPYRLHMPGSAGERAAISWLHRAWPWRSWGQICWIEVADSVCVSWSSREELAAAFERTCAGQALGNPTVMVMGVTSSHPTIELPLDAARRHVSPIFQADRDTWVFCQSEGWCFEIYHDDDLCFGRVGSSAASEWPASSPASG